MQTMKKNCIQVESQTTCGEIKNWIENWNSDDNYEFFGLLSGKTGSGKTNVIKEIVKQYGKTIRVIWMHPDDQDRNLSEMGLQSQKTYFNTVYSEATSKQLIDSRKRLIVLDNVDEWCDSENWNLIIKIMTAHSKAHSAQIRLKEGFPTHPTCPKKKIAKAAANKKRKLQHCNRNDDNNNDGGGDSSDDTKRQELKNIWNGYFKQGHLRRYMLKLACPILFVASNLNIKGLKNLLKSGCTKSLCFKEWKMTPTSQQMQTFLQTQPLQWLQDDTKSQKKLINLANKDFRQLELMLQLIDVQTPTEWKLQGLYSTDSRQTAETLAFSLFSGKLQAVEALDLFEQQKGFLQHVLKLSYLPIANHLECKMDCIQEAASIISDLDLLATGNFWDYDKVPLPGHDLLLCWGIPNLVNPQKTNVPSKVKLCMQATCSKTPIVYTAITQKCFNAIEWPHVERWQAIDLLYSDKIEPWLKQSREEALEMAKVKVKKKKIAERFIVEEWNNLNLPPDIIKLGLTKQDLIRLEKFKMSNMTLNEKVPRYIKQKDRKEWEEKIKISRRG